MASVSPEASECSPEFWECFNALPAEVQALAKEKHALWLVDTTAQSLDFKKMKGQKEPIWEVYVGRGHRAFCLYEDGIYTWFWIGTKQEALKLDF